MPISRRELMQGIVASAIAASVSAESARRERRESANTVAGISPRLYLTPATLAVLREQFRTDNGWASRLREQGESLLTIRFAEEGASNGPNRGGPRLSSLSMVLALLYHLTGESKYAAQLHEALKHYGRYPSWSSPAFLSRNPPWHSELGTAQYNLAYGNAYDALHHYLTQDERGAVRSNMIRLGILPTLNDWILPQTRIHSLDSMGHNWWGVCVGNAGVACLSILQDEPRARSWVDQIDVSFVQWFTYQGSPLHNRIETFEPDGGPSYEGAHYTTYGLANYLNYLWAWKNVHRRRTAPTDEYLKGIAEFLLHTIYPSDSGSIPINFDDCRLNSNARDTCLLLTACGLGDRYSNAYLGRVSGSLEDPLPTYVMPPAASPAEHLPLSNVYPKMGWAVMRSSWENDATVLAVKSGYTWNHAHADAGTFILLHKGSPLIIDSGTCNYARPEYSSYYRQSPAHNVVLFDGQGQELDQINRGAKFRGSVIKWFDNIGVRYIGVDATGPMANKLTRHYRHFVWVDNCILIFDDIATFTDGNLDWLLHTAADSQEISPGSLSLHNGDASATFAVLYPQVRASVREGLAPEDPDKPKTYYAFSSATKNRYQRFVSAIDLEPQSPFRVKVQETEHYLRVDINRDDRTHTLYLNLRSIEGAYDMGATIPINDWVTDAYMLMFTAAAKDSAPNNMDRYMVVDGSYLRWRGRSVLESISKGDWLWNQGSHVQVSSRGQEKISCSLGVTQRPSEVLWNGVMVPLIYDLQNQLITVQNLRDQ